MNEALDKLAARHPRQAELVKLRYFVGMTGVGTGPRRVATPEGLAVFERSYATRSS